MLAAGVGCGGAGGVRAVLAKCLVGGLIGQRTRRVGRSNDIAPAVEMLKRSLPAAQAVKNAADDRFAAAPVPSSSPDALALGMDVELLAQHPILLD